MPWLLGIFSKLLFQFQMVKLNFCVVIWLDTVLETWWYWPNIKESWLKVARDWSLIEDVIFARDTPGQIEWSNNPFFNIQEFTVPSCMILDKWNRNQSLLVPPTMKVACFQLNPGVIISDTGLKNTRLYCIIIELVASMIFLVFTPEDFLFDKNSLYIYIYKQIYRSVYVYIYIYIFQMCSYSPWWMETISDLSPNSLMSIKRWRDFGRGAVLWSGGLLGMRIQGVFIDRMKWGCFPSFKANNASNDDFFQSNMKQLNNNDHQRFPGNT